MTELINHTFEGTSITIQGDEVYANREQLQELYSVAKTTLRENIKELKKDGLIVGAEIRPKSGRSYEIYSLDEIISVGLRLRSDKAIEFQRWARNVIKEKLIEAHQKIKMQQAQLDWFWDREDRNDLYR